MSSENFNIINSEGFTINLIDKNYQIYAYNNVIELIINEDNDKIVFLIDDYNDVRSKKLSDHIILIVNENN